MPKNLPFAENIKKVEQKQKKLEKSKNKALNGINNNKWIL